MSHSLGSWPHECFWFGVEAVNRSGEAERGLILRRVEFHSPTNRDSEWSSHRKSAFTSESANSDQICLATSKDFFR